MKIIRRFQSYQWPVRMDSSGWGSIMKKSSRVLDKSVPVAVKAHLILTWNCSGIVFTCSLESTPKQAPVLKQLYLLLF